MITRRSIPLFLLLLALVVPALASADKPKGTKGPKVLILLTDGAQNGKYVNQPITASFPVPKGVTAAAACKGKVRFSVPIGKKTVKKRKKKVYEVKKALLKLVAGSCSASATLKLPQALLGKTLKFTASFKGNDAIKKFTKSSKHLVALPKPVPPPAPPLIDPAKGAWSATQTPIGSGSVQWTFTINPDNSVNAITRTGPLSVHCPMHADAVLIGPPGEEAPFDTPFKIAANDVTASDDWDAFGEHATSTFVLHFDSPTHATGTFKLDGTLYAPSVIVEPADLVPGCSTNTMTVDFLAGGIL